MQTFSPEKILSVWEAGREQHEIDRALTLLAADSPELSRAELGALSIGERDARLLQFRARLLGPRASGFVECPACSARLEFPIDTAAFAQPRLQTDDVHEIEADGMRVRFRLPTSRDLAEIVESPDAAQGLRRLVERCVVEAKGDAADPSGEFRSEVVEALSRAMLQADPQAEITLALKCPDCGHAWQMLFDVADFFWNELAAQARRLLREIDVIARAYGWTEREIMGLSTRRRQSYLELIGA